MEELLQWITTLFASKDQSDVELHVEVVQEGNTIVIPAHSIVLRHVSKIFYTMLEPGNFKEGTTGVVQIKVYGNKADAVSFVKYLYTKKLQTLDTNAYAALMRTADFYEMTTLFKMCEKRIRIGLTPFTVCGVYSALHSISTESNRDYYKEMMLKFAFLIFSEELHITLSEDAMISLLSSEKLNVLDEEQVLRAVWDWGHSKCILENVVGTKEPKDMVASLLPLIKWSDIDILESRSPWFDLHAYYEELSITENQTTERKVRNTISLSCYANCINFSQHVDFRNSSSCDDSSDGYYTLITFISDHTILLTGMELHVGISRKDWIYDPFSVYINTSYIPNTSFKSTYLRTSDTPYNFIFTVDFCKPVVLKTNQIHIINLKITDYAIEVQKLPVNSSATQSGILGSDEEVTFSVAGQIAGIQKLFYFVQN